MEIKHPDVVVRLVGGDGNMFSIIGQVASALSRAGLAVEAADFIDKAAVCESYDEVLRLCLRTVTVE